MTNFGFRVGDLGGLISLFGIVGSLGQRRRRHDHGEGRDQGWKDGFAAEWKTVLGRTAE